MHALGRTRRYLISALLSAAGVVVLWPAAASIAPAQAAVTTAYSLAATQAPSTTDLVQAHQAAQTSAAATQLAASKAYAQSIVQGAANAVAAIQIQQQQAAAAKAAQAAAQQQPQQAPTPPPAPAVSAGSLQAYALQLLGGDQTQFSCLNSVIMRESSWNVYAGNASGAYGIPQALPGSKMSAAGADWASNGETQLRWMIQMYIPGTYGTACNAWAHEQAYGWY